MIRENKYRVFMILLAILLISCWFYWFQWKPAEIRKDCVVQAKTDTLNSFKNTSTDNLIDKFYPQATSSPDKILSRNKVKVNNYYRECLVINGLKAESLFVNLE